MRRTAVLAAALLFAAQCFAAAEDAAWDGTAGSLSLLPHLAAGMNKQQKLAQKCVDKWGSSPEETLAAVYLHAHMNTTWRDQLLTCSIDHLIKNVAPSTPLDIFVFVRAEMYDTMSEELAKHLGANADRACVLPIPQEQWSYQLPRATPYQLPNNTNRYADYLVMGQWRLLVPNNIMYALGYPYTVQADDDLFVTEPFKVNVLQHMRSNSKLMGTHRISREGRHIMYGLPEMARFFLLSNQLQPGTSMLRHIYTHKLADLESLPLVFQPDDPKRGYDLSILWGNFLIMSTDLWRDPKVQDWIALCMGSGGLERHRWQEQGVMSFIWLLFTNEEDLWQLEPPVFNYVHGRDPEYTQPLCGVTNPNVLARRRRAAAMHQQAGEEGMQVRPEEPQAHHHRQHHRHRRHTQTAQGTCSADATDGQMCGGVQQADSEVTV